MDGKVASPGFTLVEAMVTVSLFVIVLGLGAPSLSRWGERQKALSQTGELYRLLCWAQMESYTKKAPHGFWFGNDSSFSEATVRRDGNGDGTVTDSDPVVRNYQSSTKWKASGTPAVVFDVHGVSGGDFTFHLETDVPEGAPDCVRVVGNVIYKGAWNGSACIVL
jgi:Tfp pilus assembly protein FimT